MPGPHDVLYSGAIVDRGDALALATQPRPASHDPALADYGYGMVSSTREQARDVPPLITSPPPALVFARGSAPRLALPQPTNAWIAFVLVIVVLALAGELLYVLQ